MHGRKETALPEKWSEVKEMLEHYKTVYEGGQGEITEKKSRFICNVRLTETEEEALAFIEEMKKKYWDARHNCYAYVIGERGEWTRCSDDGEPSGTAGRPMLDVLQGEELHNVTVVVTRYFGGILLGTGGLVRAYSGAVQEGLRNSRLIEKKRGFLLEVITDYNGLGKIQYLAGEREIPVIHAEYTEKVVMQLLVPAGRLQEMEKAVTEATSGRAGMRREKELYFAKLDGEYLLFEH